MELLYPKINTHANNFDFLRFVLATMVVFTHSYAVHSGPSISDEFLWVISDKQIECGTLALNFFFVVSGFLVAKSWDNSLGFFDFIKKRILRIYPAFITACFLCAYVFAPLGLGIIRPPRYIIEYWSYVDFPYLILNSLRLGDLYWLPETFKKLPCPNDVNASIWSIPYEFVCYLFIPLIALVRHRLAPLVVFLIMLAGNIYHYNAHQMYNEAGAIPDGYLPGFLYNYLGDEWRNSPINFEHVFAFFMAGICFYAYRQYIPRSGYLAILSLAIMVAATFWARVFELTQLVFGSYLLFYFAFSRRIKLHKFGKYGDFSYGIYLYGWPIQQVVVLYFGSQLTVMGVFLITMLFALIAAYLSWHLVEKPLLSLKNLTMSLVSVRS